MHYRRMPIEAESPEEYGYDRIAHNLSESSVADAHLRDLKLNLEDVVLLYGEHRGLRPLREAIAAMYEGIGPDDVLITPGAAAALFILHTVLLEAGDHLIVEHPNYSTNLETPRTLGCELARWRLGFEQGFRPNPAWLDGQLNGRTRLVSLTTPHNPSGHVLRQDEFDAIVGRVLASQAYLLVDETYRDLCYAASQPPLAARLDPRVISVSSLSKAYGLPGIRIGWIICRDARLLDRCLAAKEQILICNSVVDETIALQLMSQRESWLGRMRTRAEAQLQLLAGWMQQQSWLEWVAPEGGVVCFPRFRAEVRERAGQADYERFYRVLLDKHGTFVGPGHWFEMPDSYLRIGYAWPEAESLRAGLAGIEAAAEEVWGD